MDVFNKVLKLWDKQGRNAMSRGRFENYLDMNPIPIGPLFCCEAVQHFDGTGWQPTLLYGQDLDSYINYLPNQYDFM